jgi:hypothetical protein
MARVCDLLATLALDARQRVVAYVNQRADTLAAIEASANGASGPGELFEQAGSEPAPIEAAGG